jgi:hypothetical protein
MRLRLRRPTEDEWDAWLDEHRRVDRAITRAYGVKLRIQWAVPQWRERRRWRPGMFYLDHGSLPCVLVRLYDGDTLEGVSMVDGALVGGCSIYACGPEPVGRKEAMRLATQMREELREERAAAARYREDTGYDVARDERAAQLRKAAEGAPVVERRVRRATGESPVAETDGDDG